MAEYDSEPIGGIMGQIVAMTAPPGTPSTRDTRNGVQNIYNGPSNTLTLASQTETTGLAAHPYFRRPGKGHNRDSCDACSEGGDLICCDICPASFHLTCHDPPLDEDKIPVGEWMCHQCRMKKEDDKVTNGRNGKSGKVQKKKEKEDEENNCVWSSGRQMNVSKTSLCFLVKEAASINPKQFSLPYEMTLPANFPNEPKDTTTRRNGRTRLGRKKPYELDNGLTPRPAILCFQCSKSCRVGPIIPCDYCHLFYHLDCVNPPLTIPPTGKWMCPTHPEQFVDSNLTSHSLIERVKIWDKFTRPLDEHSIKMNFFRKCNKEKTNSKFKIKKVTRSRVKVPRGVKCQYSNPPELLPHLSSSSFVPMPPLVHKSSGVESLLNASDYLNNSDHKEQSIMDPQEPKMEMTEPTSAIEQGRPTEEDKKVWLLGLLKFQSDMYSELSKDKKTPDETKLMNGTVASCEDERPVVNGDLSFKQHTLTTKSKPQKRKSNQYKNHKSSSYKKPRNNVEILLDTLNSLANSLKENIEDNANIKLTGLNETLMEVLAYQKILDIITPPEDEDKIIKIPSIPARALLCPLVPEITLKCMAPTKRYSSDPVAMTFRILKIGKGSHNHVNLELFGNCNYISAQHAAITYDQNAGSYELLNYSEHGTKVDGISLNCNFSDKTVSEAAVPTVLAQVREIADHNRGFRKYTEQENLPKMTSMPGKSIEPCGCGRTKENGKGTEDETISHGWEGASLLHHGSYIKFGCVSFVFSLVETAIHGDWSKDVLATYETFLIKTTDAQPSDSPDQKTQLS